MIMIRDSDGIITWLAASAIAAVRETAERDKNTAYVRLLDGTECPSYDRSAPDIVQEIEFEVNK